MDDDEVKEARAGGTTEVYALRPQDLKQPVAPSKQKVSKEHNAYRIAVGLMVGIGALLAVTLAMIAKITWAPNPEDAEAAKTWMEVFGQVKELSIFVLGALLGHWYKGDAV